MRTQTVKLSDVEAGLNNRKRFDPAHIANLAKDKIYLVAPPTYRPHPTIPDKWQIIKGECRTRAARLNGETEITVFVEESDNRTARRGMYQENHNRMDTNPIEDAEFFRDYAVEWSLLNENGDPDAAKIADDLGAKRSFVTSRLLLLRLNAKFQDAVRDDVITLRLAEILARLDKVRQDLAFKTWSLLPDAERTADKLEDTALKYKREEQDEIARLAQSDMFACLDLSAPTSLTVIEWRQQFGITDAPTKTTKQELEEVRAERDALKLEVEKINRAKPRILRMCDENAELKRQLDALRQQLLDWKASTQAAPIGANIA